MSRLSELNREMSLQAIATLYRHTAYWGEQNDLTLIVNAFFDLVESVPLDRLKEICNAEREGRCVVLPVKVGDRIYRLFRGEITELLVGNAMYETLFSRWKVFTTPYMCIYWKDSFGKTIFLTREEAEAALKGAEHDRD